MKVSIIIPVYNVERLLPKCLDSVFHQTVQDFELICINDRSPDNSMQILEEYQQKYSEKMIILDNEINMGQGRSRKRAMDIAKGEYIMFIDSDDYVTKDYVETYLKAMEEHPCDVVAGGFTKDIAGAYTEHAPSRGEWSVLTYPIPCAKMYRKAFLLENNIHFSDIRCGEDIYFALSQFYHQINFHVIDYYGYYYYQNANSTTESLTYDKEHEKNVAEIFTKFLSDHDISLLSEIEKDMVEYTYVANMVNALVTYGHGCKPHRMKQKYAFFMQDMKAKFPEYKKNCFYGLLKPKGQTLKIRLGVGVTMLLHKVGLDRLMFYVISLI